MLNNETNKRCGNCEYYDEINVGFAEDGTSDGLCMWGREILSSAYLRATVTQSDHGETCATWRPKDV